MAAPAPHAHGSGNGSGSGSRAIAARGAHLEEEEEEEEEETNRSHGPQGRRRSAEEDEGRRDVKERETAWRVTYSRTGTDGGRGRQLKAQTKAELTERRERASARISIWGSQLARQQAGC